MSVVRMCAVRRVRSHRSGGWWCRVDGLVWVEAGSEIRVRDDQVLSVSVDRRDGGPHTLVLAIRDGRGNVVVARDPEDLHALCSAVTVRRVEVDAAGIPSRVLVELRHRAANSGGTGPSSAPVATQIAAIGSGS